MATIYAQLGAPSRWEAMETSARHAVRAMTAHPYLVAGRNRADTAVMTVAPGVVAKGGAEGLLCAAIPASGLGIAVKVDDGASRATGPALIHVLDRLQALSAEQVQKLAPFARPAVLGGGEPVGEIDPMFDLAFT
jgi:L-asparaginase II